MLPIKVLFSSPYFKSLLLILFKIIPDCRQNQSRSYFHLLITKYHLSRFIKIYENQIFEIQIKGRFVVLTKIIFPFSFVWFMKGWKTTFPEVENNSSMMENSFFV